jgi:hypothetical protein
VYAVNYNVLRVMSGMAGVAYSNWSNGVTFIICVTFKLIQIKINRKNKIKIF